VTGE
jgi:hypothetical protein